MGCHYQCPLDCSTNYVCNGYQDQCGGNQTAWTAISGGKVTIIRASHLTEMENALNAEKTDALRRGITPACPSNCSDAITPSGKGLGDAIAAADFNNLASEINGTYYNVDMAAYPGTPSGSVGPTVSGGKVQAILASYITSLRAAINAVEYACICDSYSVLECGCNGQCPLHNVSG